MKIRYTGTVSDVKRAENDMMPLLWEGFAQVTHNSRKNGAIKLNGNIPNYVVRQYRVLRPVPDDFLEMEITVVFEYNRALNRGRIRIEERDAERLWPML